MNKIFLGIACFCGLFVHSPAHAQEAEVDWRVVVGKDGATLVRLYGYEVDPVPDFVFDCAEGQKSIYARWYEFSGTSFGEGVTLITDLLPYAADSQPAEGCDQKCSNLMNRFAIDWQGKPVFPAQYAAGHTTWAIMMKRFYEDINGEEWRHYDKKTRNVWTDRLRIFKRKCKL